MKVVLIDPWGIKNTADYLNGLIAGLGTKISLVVFTNYFFKQYVDVPIEVKRVFFKNSEHMKKGFKRKLFRGIEYVLGYLKVLKYIKKHKDIDVIHINWLLFYRVDRLFLRIIKKYTRKLVYTAHNAIPHIESEKELKFLESIYQIVERIVVHGDSVKNEIQDFFDIPNEKFYIQKHGCILRYSEPSNLKKWDNIYQECSKFKKIFIFFGAIFPNKGVDRLANCWISHYQNIDTMLIIIGQNTTNDYAEFVEKVPVLEKIKNVMLLNQFIEDDLLNALINISDLIILPYKHASMSGVVFTAAQFSKPILCTDVGALSEYLDNGIDSIICDNNDDAFYRSMDFCMTLSKDQLKTMGYCLHTNIMNKCNWDTIGNGLISKVYER